jgi:hypothetical protein
MANPIITLPNSYTRTLVAAIASLTLCDAAPAAMEDQIMRITHPLGLAAGMAVDTQGAFAEDKSGRLLSKAGGWAMDDFDGAAMAATRRYAEDGAKEWCPVAKNDPDLLAADTLAKQAHGGPAKAAADGWAGAGARVAPELSTTKDAPRFGPERFA